ncbi:hypothetical protein appser6_11370 [Actinobacillus pleuropneumoniae serovar 6 str. Femo]|uniref:Uncharacterized protein n=1 Tax=Actinobacillus pleuropneumoniae serovar 6 str. Femo TaxID=754256 RepID=A0A828PL81_ACTPL|nr:hypothetical protein appser6_11370 [Actinobacillus pleuropneumoniae serovar 6 str. Femo]EFM96422.1 hypothetical protein appser10_10330 [Actinobacillus pleuropneumoniae serovar 10 str. D13039]
MKASCFLISTHFILFNLQKISGISPLANVLVNGEKRFTFQVTK